VRLYVCACLSVFTSSVSNLWGVRHGISLYVCVLGHQPMLQFFQAQGAVPT
jgi:hypothetical protein